MYFCWLQPLWPTFVSTPIRPNLQDRFSHTVPEQNVCEFFFSFLRFHSIGSGRSSTFSGCSFCDTCCGRDDTIRVSSGVVLFAFLTSRSDSGPQQQTFWFALNAEWNKCAAHVYLYIYQTIDRTENWTKNKIYTCQ